MWHTVVPILDKSQTDGLRAYSKQVADKAYTIAKSDFQLLMKEIEKMGFKDNTASLIFSYLLDGQMWTELVLFEEINKMGTTILMVTHSEKIVNDMKKRVIQLENGCVVRDEQEGVYNLGV